MFIAQVLHRPLRPPTESTVVVHQFSAAHPPEAKRGTKGGYAVLHFIIMKDSQESSIVAKRSQE